MRQIADMTRWHGRNDDAEGPMGRRWHQVVQQLELAQQPNGIALVGFACDAGVARNQGRIGAAEGPAALRSILGNLPLRHCMSIVDAGDVVCLSDYAGKDLESAQEAFAVLIDDLLSRGLMPIAMGGGHEIAYGSFNGLARFLAGKRKPAFAPRIGIINFDAHFDMRLSKQATSGTPFRQIAEDCQAKDWPFHYLCLGISEYANTVALFERAKAFGVRWRLDEDMGIVQLDDTLSAVDHFLQGVDHVYLTVCLDVFPAYIAPGVSAPSARGVTLEVVEPIIDRIVASGKVRVADVAELNPEHDIDHRTARVGARLIARIAERSHAR